MNIIVSISLIVLIRGSISMSIRTIALQVSKSRSSRDVHNVSVKASPRKEELVLGL